MHNKNFELWAFKRDTKWKYYCFVFFGALRQYVQYISFINSISYLTFRIFRHFVFPAILYFPLFCISRHFVFPAICISRNFLLVTLEYITYIIYLCLLHEGLMDKLTLNSADSSPAYMIEQMHYIHVLKDRLIDR